MDRLENGWLTSGGYGGTVYVPKASGGCALVFPPPGPNCVRFPTLTVPGMPAGAGGYPDICWLSEQQFSQSITATLNGFRDQLYDGRHEHAVAVCAEQLHQQPAALHRSDCHCAQAATGRVGDRVCWEVRGCITRRRSESCSPIRWPIFIPSVAVGALDADDVQFVPGSGYPIPAVAGLRTTAGAAINGNGILRAGAIGAAG